jgi:acetate kinase
LSILVINAGSSTLKFALFDGAALSARLAGLIDWSADPRSAKLLLRPTDGPETQERIDVADHRAAVASVLKKLADSADHAIEAVGHRVVHGGPVFRASVRIDAAVKKTLANLVELAPLHNPPALEAIDTAQAALPDVPHVAVFDTAFFASFAERAFIYPLPYAWYTDWGIRRFGFHGISHAYCAGRSAEVLGRALSELRLIICHLGNGCSASAVKAGQAIATTMGYTPLEGLMMGTRSGSIDPSILIHVERKHGLTAEQVDQVLNHQSGLLGVSGVASDFRQVEAASQQGNARAQLALDMYADRVRSAVGALAVTLGGVDALVFTAGVGENSATLRAAVCRGLECLGLHLDAERNAHCQPDADLADPASPGRILALHTREELLIARETLRVGMK